MFFVKENGTIVIFDKNKIKKAIVAAMRDGGVYLPDIARLISIDTERYFLKEGGEQNVVTREQVDKYIFDRLIHYGQNLTAKSYEDFKTLRKYQKQTMDSDESILGLINGSNKNVIEENSNKDAKTNSTVRDLIAGEESKSISRRKLIPAHLIHAHDEGLIHIHDLDYYLQPMHNCFARDTKFVTSKGLKSFKDFNNGDIIKVLSIDGKYHKAIVKSYGEQELYTYTFYNGKKEFTHEVKATANHRWILKDGTETTNLKIGDKLIKAPKIYNQNIDFDNLPYKCQLAWCKGFGLGDGTVEYGSKDSNGKSIQSNTTRIRLCGQKDLQYINRFSIEGCSIRQRQYENGDKEVSILDYTKEIPEFSSLLEMQCFFNGLYCADGNTKKSLNGRINYRLQSSKKEVIDFIRKYADSCGLYITRERELTGEQTNYGIRPYTIYFSFNPDFYFSYSVLNKQYYGKEEVWCLEVEDTHNFILQYGIPTGNCCLINLKDMLNNGTVVNDVLIERPHSIGVACNVATQIVACVASSQFGGQTISTAHLAPFVRESYNGYLKEIKEELKIFCHITKEEKKELASTMAMKRTQKAVKDAVQTLQYQINTLCTSNGQTPFVSIYMEIKEEPEYAKENAMLIEEIIKQRYIGLKDREGHYVTPAFPKLLYVLDEYNTYKGSQYFYITEAAARCSAKRLVPDYISAKVMKENTGGYVFPCMGCRSFLSIWKDENDKAKFYGRWNGGVVTVNLVDAALSAEGDLEEFWKILEDRCNLCKEALLLRVKKLEVASPDVAPILWKDGALARLKEGETIESMTKSGYSTLSLGYIGIAEACYALIGESNTSEEGEKLALEIMSFLNKICANWKKETGYGFSLYGTPAESTTYTLAKTTKNRFGIIPNVTDKLYLTNSYHVKVNEPIDAFTKLKFEAQFQKLSSGGSISYVEIPNMMDNIPAVLQLIQYIYENIQYAELNCKSDKCENCGYEGEILIDDNLEWECPKCGCRDHNKLHVARRTCGYIGSNFWNKGRTQEIKERVLHLD